MEKESTTDTYRRVILNIDDSITALLNGQRLNSALFHDSVEIDLYNEHVEQVLEGPKLNENLNLSMTVNQFYHSCSKTWLMPDKYLHMDIYAFLIDKCQDSIQRNRVNKEYQLFKERDLIPLLQFLLYFSDYMKKNKYGWNIGRGSSVSSYILFLLGVHKIDSLKYGLCVEEFLK